ncbi:hypothetical protein RFI_05701 [Reticulomyxa filosa]|uniref:Uncharacterized protein n=1 Tax=Reticulomyxa filosa TaxID=46433 RepID=X6NYP5_RETFI|nr:hypothetical protein RFI_05701 [Reticulomyxa filosa]|eukprot:ETO31420.1 hypothetical protein RFI_05701 [Reticulomyxa filosa]
MQMFDELIDKIIGHVNTLISTHADVLDNKLKFLCLVGGFSQSPYLQHRLKQQFEPKFTFIIPDRPILSVIQGAAQLGRIASFVKSRVLNKTYGTSCAWPMKKAIDANVSQVHIKKHKYLNDIYNTWSVAKCFAIFKAKSEKVKVNEMVELEFQKSKKDQKSANIVIYCSDQVKPTVITGSQRLGEITVYFPDDFDTETNSLRVRFYFGNTTIRVTAAIKGEKWIEKELQIKYDFDLNNIQN